MENTTLKHTAALVEHILNERGIPHTIAPSILEDTITITASIRRADISITPTGIAVSHWLLQSGQWKLEHADKDPLFDQEMVAQIIADTLST
jgi:hypothetical protein